MNAAAGSIGVAAMLVAPPPVTEGPALDEAPGGDFTAALAAAVAPLAAGVPAEQLADSLPEDMQSAAALAWMAGMLNAEVPRREAPATAPAADAGGSTVAVATPPMLAAEAIAAAAEFAEQLSMAAVTDDQTAATDSTAPLALMKAFGAEITRAAAAGPPAKPLHAGVPGADTQQPDSIPDVARLLAVFADQAAAQGAPAPEIDTQPLAPASQTPSPALYSQSRESLALPVASDTGAAGTVRTPVGAPRWADEVGSRLVLMSMRGQQEGSLSLTPEHLGPLEVRISVAQDSTNVWFGAQHADTRAALTDALPRLRELFAASGLALGHAGVSHEMPRQDARQAEAAAAISKGARDGGDTLAVEPAVRRIRSALLDAWA